MTLEEGEKVQVGLQEALSHQQFLTDTLNSALLETLKEKASEALGEAEALRTSLREGLKVFYIGVSLSNSLKLSSNFVFLDSKDLEESDKDVAHGNAEETLVVAPPRKKSNEKREEEKKVPSAEKSASFEDNVSAKLQATEDTLIIPDLSSEALGPAEDHGRSSSSEFTVETIQAAVEEQSESSKPLADQDKQQAAVGLMEKTENVETKLIPIRRKSKNSGSNTSLQKLQSEENSESDGLKCSLAVPEPTGSVDDSWPLPIERRSVDLKLSSESATLEETESEREPGAETSPLTTLQTDTVAGEAKEMPAIIQDGSDPSTEVVKTVDPEIPMRKKSKSFEVSTVSDLVSPLGRGTATLFEGPGEPEKCSTTPESVQAQDESAVEQNKPLPPKRKPKGSDLPLKSDTEEHQTKGDPDVERLTSGLTETVDEETKLVPTRRKSKNGQVSIISETAFHLRPDNVEPQEVNSQKPSNTGMAVTATAVEDDKSKLSPTQRKPKGPKYTPETASKAPGKTIKEPGRQQSLEKTEGKLTPIRRRSKTSVIDLESKDAGKETEGRGNSSQGSPLTSETTVQAEKKLLTITRKSQSPKISPKPSPKDEAKASANQGKVGQVSEKPPVEEPQVIPTKRSKESIKSQKSTEQTETTVSEKGKISPAKRKPRVLKHSKESPTRDVTKPDTQQQSSSPKMTPDKAKSAVLEKGKLSPTKRKSKAGKPSKDLGTTELPKTKEEHLAPDMVKESSNNFESTLEETVELSPKERKSKGLKVPSESADRELVQNPEESDIQALSSASHVHKTAVETTIEEDTGISPVKVLSEGLKESSDVSEPEVTDSTEESDAERKLSSPEEVTSDNITPEVPETGLMQTKEEVDLPVSTSSLSPLEVAPTDVTEIKPHPGDWKPTAELSVQETKTRRYSDGQKSSSTAEEDESDGQDFSSAQVVVDTEKKPMLEQEIELDSEEVEGVTSELEPKTDDIYIASQVTEAPEPSPEVSTNELTQSIEACSPGVVTESTEISVFSVSELLEETRQNTEDEKGMSLTLKQSESLSPEDASEVDTAENMQHAEGAATDETPVTTQPEEGEEFPAPETASPLQRNTDEMETSAAAGWVGSLTPSVTESPQSEVKASTNNAGGEQNTTPSMENDLSRLSNEPANLSEYIDNLWKDADENEKRFMVLDLPEVSFSQTSDRLPDRRETAVECSSELGAKDQNATLLEDAPAAKEKTEDDTVVEVQHRVSEDVSAQISFLPETAHPNQNMVEPVEICLSEDVETLNQIKIPTKEEVKEETPDTMDTVDVSTEQIHVEPEVHIIQLDTEREGTPECKMIITADVDLQEPSAKKPDMKVKESSADVLRGGSAESNTPSEFIEISIYETSQTETSKEPLEVLQMSPAPVREEPEILDENYVKMEKIEKGSEVHVFHQDTQMGIEEEIMSVKISKEPTLDVNLSIQCGKDLTSNDVLLEADSLELTVFGVSGEERGSVLGREQVSGNERTTADLQLELATGEEDQEIKGPEQNQLISSQCLTDLELKGEQEAHTEVKDEVESDVKVSPSDVYDAADSLAEPEPKEASSISLETENEGKGVTANEIQSGSIVVTGDASESPTPSVQAEQQVIDTREGDQDQKEKEKLNIPSLETDTMEVEIVSIPPLMVKTTSTLEEMESVASLQVRRHFICTQSQCFPV